MDDQGVLRLFLEPIEVVLPAQEIPCGYLIPRWETYFAPKNDILYTAFV